MFKSESYYTTDYINDPAARIALDNSLAVKMTDGFEVAAMHQQFEGPNLRLTVLWYKPGSDTLSNRMRSI